MSRRLRATTLSLLAWTLVGLVACSADSPTPGTEPPGTTTSSSSRATGTVVPDPSASVTSTVPSRRTFTVADGLPSDRVLGVDANEDGTVWVTVGRDELDTTLARLENGRWRVLDPPARFFGRPGLAAGPDGTAWIVTDGFLDAAGLWEHDGDDWTTHLDCTPEGTEAGRCQRGASEAHSLAVGGDGEVWASGFVSEGPTIGCGFLRREGGGWNVYGADPLERSEPIGGFCAVEDFAPDGHPHALVDEGLFRLDRGGWTQLAAAPGTPASADLQLVHWAVGADGTVWTLRADPSAVTLVFERFDGSSWKTIPIGADGLATVDIDRACVLAEDPGRDPADLESQLADPLGLANFVNAHLLPLAVDSHGGVWTAIRCSGLIRTGPDGDVTHTLTEADGLPSLRLTDVDIGPSGAVWVSTLDGLVRLVPEP